MPETNPILRKNYTTTVHLKTENSETKLALSMLKYIIWANRAALAIVFFWFGFLKLLNASPAEALVMSLHDSTIARYIPMQVFLELLGGTECLIGILWLIPRCTKFVFWLFIPQMITTFMPLIFLPGDTWQSSFCLTLTGQYIIKNLVLVASALTVFYAYIKTKK